MSSNSISVRFWGVRGSLPCPGPETVRYGGNTSCVEIRCGERVLVFDAGSGIRLLGNSIAQATVPKQIDLFLSHCHIDHLIGLPFYSPLFEKDHGVRLWAGGLTSIGGVKEAVRRLMSFPLFPIEIEAAQGKIEFSDFVVGENLEPHPGIVIRTAKLNHPGGATGYRIEYAGKAVAYITDTELGNGPIDPALLKLIEQAELLIIDATYTDAEIPAHIGWGHSSWQQVVRLADQARVKTLCLFHHDPDHDDPALDEIAAASARVRPDTLLAREGMIVTI